MEISKLLEKFKQIRNPKEVRVLISSEINKLIGSNLVKEADLTIKGGVLHIATNPVVRHKIFANKDKVILAVNNVQSDQKIINII